MPGESHRSIFNINITLYSVLVYLLIHGYSCCSWRVFLAFRKSDCLAAEVWGTEHEGQDVSGGGAVVEGGLSLLMMTRFVSVRMLLSTLPEGLVLFLM